MFKRAFSMAIVLFVLFSLAASAFAGEGKSPMCGKMKRGAINTVTGWVELPIQVYRGCKQGYRGDENQKVLGFFTGLGEGICAAAGRTVSGVVDVIGFWALSPESNEGVGIPLEAEYAIDEGEVYDLMEPSIEEATVKPVVNKLQRGVLNTLLGITEIPGQIAKGVKEGQPFKGIGRGLWYFLSRELSGVYDLVTVCVPTPKESVGFHFDQEWPWTNIYESAQ